MQAARAKMMDALIERLIDVARPDSVNLPITSEGIRCQRAARRKSGRARASLLHWPTTTAGGHSRLPTPVLTGSGSTGLSQPFASAKSTPDELPEC